MLYTQCKLSFLFLGDGGLFGENTGLFGDDFNKETPQQGEDNSLFLLFLLITT